MCIPDAFGQYYQGFRKIGKIAAGTQSDQIHSALMSATFEVKESAVNRRRASISNDGPIVYSFKSTAADGSPSFRFLCEPGGLGISVSEQVNFSRQALSTLAKRLGWHSALSAANAVLAQVIPCESSAMSDWWGGLWLGAEIGSDSVELRVYANLRHGDFISRWQRVANLLATFADERLIPTVTDWIDCTGRIAIPVGVGLVLTKTGMPVVRVYVGVERPSAEAALGARGNSFSGSDSVMSLFCNEYVATFGPFRQQSMTLGYDFVRDVNGTFHPKIARFKMDVSLGHLGLSTTSSPEEFVIKQWQQVFPQTTDSYLVFREELARYFGGSALEYISLSVRSDQLSGMTVYVRPDGYAWT